MLMQDETDLLDEPPDGDEIVRVAQLCSDLYSALLQQHRLQAIETMSLSMPRFAPIRPVSVIVEPDQGDECEATMRRPTKPSIWLKVAERVIRMGFNPARFIRRQFLMIEPTKPTPFPNFFVSDQAIVNYRKAFEIKRVVIASGLVSEVASFKTEVVNRKTFESATDNQAWEDTLKDDSLSLTPLFRYCIASSLGRDSKIVDRQTFGKMATLFRPAAAAQYLLCDDIYDASPKWKAMFPPNWSTLSRETYLKTFFEGSNHASTEV
jgi:hypothetical protein